MRALTIRLLLKTFYGSVGLTSDEDDGGKRAEKHVFQVSGSSREIKLRQSGRISSLLKIAARFYLLFNPRNLGSCVWRKVFSQP